KPGTRNEVRPRLFGRLEMSSSPPTFSPSRSPTTVSSIFVGAGAGLIRDLDVSLNIAHTHDPDLDVTLTHVPSGISVELFTDVPSDLPGADGFVIRRSDQAGVDIGSATGTAGAAITGLFDPEGAAVLSAFNGIDATGEWRLTIVDDLG